MDPLHRIDGAIDLEVTSQQELERIPACDSDSQIINISGIDGLHAPHACSNYRAGEQRELHNNPFPTESPRQ